jgi:Protein of unknown function (DUF4240)
MDLDEFWGLIEQSRQETSDPDARLQWLQDQLARQPTAEIIDFQLWIDRLRRRVDTMHMWGAAYLIKDGFCSSDGFWYFQVWLIGLGREAFERAATNPDDLATIPEVRRLAGRSADDWSLHEWPSWELLDGVASRAYEQITGEEEGLYHAMVAQGHSSPNNPSPTDEPWDFEDPVQAAQRLPRLSRLFPLSDRATPDERIREAVDGLLAEQGLTEEDSTAEFPGPDAGHRPRKQS